MGTQDKGVKMARVPITISTTEETRQLFKEHTEKRGIPFSTWSSEILKSAVKREVKAEMIEQAEINKLMGA
jgi:hypothetical protein